MILALSILTVLEINNRTLKEEDVTPEFAAGFVAGVNAAGGTP